MSKRLFFLTSFVLVLSLVCNVSGQGTGTIMYEIWSDIGGTAIADLTGNADFPDNPTSGEELTLFETPTDIADNFGGKVYGWLHPATSGDYTFWIATDDDGDLLLSTDDDPANAVVIAEVVGWCPARAFDGDAGSPGPNQMSAPVSLVGGQKYYVEAIYKEGGGGDNLAVAWQGPDSPDRTVIDGSFLSPAPWNPALLRAKDPTPADGAVDADTASLEWTAGPSAVSHKVYLSTDDTIDDADLAAETDLTIHLAALDVGAAYYWRVDEVEADGTIREGNVWSFTTLPLEAHFPSPADGAVEVKTGTQLEWTAGKGVIMHDVYFGTDEALVAAADASTFKGKVMVASFDPGAFEAAVTYYWKIDEFSVTGTNAGPVWSLTGFDPDVASDPDPANGAGDVDEMPVLSWAAGETASLHDVYFGTDAALVEAGDASVFQGQQTEASFAPADALERGITYYWKVDITTGTERDGMFHPGKLWSLRVVDRNTNNWEVTVAGDSPAYLDTFVEDALYDIGALSGDITYEFVVKSNPDEVEASMALIGRRGFGDTQVGIKYEQWNNTGTYGATTFGVMDFDYGVPTAPGEYTVLTFVSSEDTATTTLYVNGVNEGSIASAITLSGLVGIGYGAEGEDGSGAFDNFDGTVFGVAIFDSALADDVIAKHSDAYFTPIAISDPDLLIHYDFESGEGLTAIDRSGHGNHGLLMGTPEWVTGIFGGALSLESADVDYVETSAPLNIVTNTVSVAGWVKHDETPVAWSGILTHRGTDPGCLGLQHDGNVLTYMWGADQYWSFASGLAIPNGEWYFAALAVAPDQATLYLNGIEQTATNVAEHVPTNLDGLISVGRDIGFGGDRVMTGLIDEVRLYNKTLTDVEILGIMGAVSDVTALGDVVQGVPNDGDWPGAETPDLAFDDDATKKYLHFKGGSMSTGVQVEPASGSSVVTGLTLTTANDDYGRDPITFELSGSNESIDGPYELIAAGDIVDFAQEELWPRFTKNATPIMFDNDVAYKYYQVLLPVGRANNDGLMQIAEVELLGVPAPVAHWTFDDGAGTVAADSSGNGNDGTLVGDPQWVAGAVGGALEFDGIDDYVDCGNPAVLDITGDITLSAWIKVAAFTKTWETIMGKGDDSYRMSRGPGDGDSIHFGANGTGDNLDANTIVTTDTWRHVALVYNGTDKITYIDGVEDARLASSGNINSSGYNFYIGQNSQQAGRFLTGAVDDVRIYNQALSALQVSALANPAADDGGADDAGPANLLVNGGFEDGVADPWSTYGDATLEVVQEDPIEGSSSLHVTVASAGANFWDAGLQHGGHVFEAGKSYALSVWFKSKSGPFQINIKPERAADPWEGYGSQEITITEEWAEYTVETGVIPDAVDPASITFHIAYAPGEFLVDDVKFYEVE